MYIQITKFDSWVPYEQNKFINSTDEDASLRTESSGIINLRGVSTKLNKYILAMQSV